MSEQIPIVAFFISPIFTVNDILKGEKNINEYPLYQIIFKYIISVILFSINWKFELKNINLKDELNRILISEIGLFGFIVSSGFLIICIYYYFQKDIHKKIQYISLFIICSLIAIFICSLIMKIPIVSKIIIFISYTCLTFSPFSKYKEIYYNKDYKLIDGFDLWSLFFLNIGLLFQSILIGFTDILLLFILNSFISLIGIFIYLLLYFLVKYQNKDPNLKIEGNVIDNYYKKQNDYQSNEYHPPSMKDDVTDLV